MARRHRSWIAPAACCRGDLCQSEIDPRGSADTQPAPGPARVTSQTSATPQHPTNQMSLALANEAQCSLSGSVRRAITVASRVKSLQLDQGVRACAQCSREEILLPIKEVIQPHLPVRLPCYDLVPLTPHTFGRSLLTVEPRTSGADNSGDLTGSVYKPRERIHRSIADLRLLAIPPSCSRVADCNLN